MNANEALKCAAQILGMDPSALKKAIRPEAGIREPLATPNDAARILKTTRRNIYNMLNTGRLTRITLGKRSVRIPMADIDGILRGER